MMYFIKENKQIGRKTWRMQLQGDVSHINTPGQFVNISVPGKFLRRPISIADWNMADDSLLLLYDVVGAGTEIMSEMKSGERLDVLCPLGNGFDTSVELHRPILLGGGIGCAPMLGLARELKEKGKEPTVALGFNTRADVILREELEALGIAFHVATADGSEGVQGFVTDLYQELSEKREPIGELPFDYFYACGPNPMLKAVCQKLDIPGEVSLDERMGCGFGACMGCTIKTVDGPKRTCKEGPVFKTEKLIWE
ncbi:MAG: dihydroorotate dehydrogenase electron transfer subunit [Clostridium sp.]|nr:dihydroorotate dehydrogenase electron transfer subunit [Prevotella sp.]MCM1429211.1 dihydroorotate dehydrogenase electron transfer subunit [Clostridium sp.]MCM1475816.1 dihydroorotate dehydrogenase electron transfer subunit [Muribaculaceae bacterium]